MTPTEAPKSAGRIHGLDAARALAVIAMVFGHTMHGTLSEAAMQVGWVQRYWLVRSFTAPVFLFLSGWVVFLVVTRKGLQGREVLRGYLPRVALLFAIGYGLRFPIFDLWGLWRLDPVLLRYWATFDALHCIAASMLALLLVCAAFPKRVHRELALLGLLGLVAIAGAPVWSAFSRPGSPALLAQTLGRRRVVLPAPPVERVLLLRGADRLVGDAPADLRASASSGSGCSARRSRRSPPSRSRSGISRSPSRGGSPGWSGWCSRW